MLNLSFTKNMSCFGVNCYFHDGYAVFFRTVITESSRVKMLVLPTEIFRKAARLSNIHDPEIEKFQ